MQQKVYFRLMVTPFCYEFAKRYIDRLNKHVHLSVGLRFLWMLAIAILLITGLGCMIIRQ